jgi:hypothetical protein
VRRARAALALAAALIACAASVASAAAAPPPGAAPRVLNIVRTKVKARKAGAYSAVEAQIARAYDRAKASLYWICLQAKETEDVLYLNLYDSVDVHEQMPAAYQELVKRHPELLPLQERLKELTGSTSSTLTRRREEIDPPLGTTNFATMRNLRLTVVQVQPGREGDFMRAIRTANPKEGTWLVYEANDASTFFLVTLKRTAIGRRDGPPMPRALRRSKGVYLKSETRTYVVRPLMSHVPQAFAAANPQLWKPSSAVSH